MWIKNKRLSLTLLALVLTAIIISACNDVSSLRYRLNPNLVRGTSPRSDFNIEQVVYKTELLQGLIDRYFLFEQDHERIEELIFTGLMSALDDPYSAYFTAEAYSALQEATSGRFYGIGIQISPQVETGDIRVVQVFSNSPALESGIKAEDLLYKIAGQEVQGKDVSQVVALLTGEEGSTVSVEIYRPTTSEYISMEVERREITIDSVTTEILDSGIGYIRIVEFDELTHGQFVDAYENLKEQGARGLLIDLRNNPGGLLSSVVSVLDSVLPEGLIVYTEYRDSEGERYYSSSDSQIDLPIVVLINGASASAAEVFASAIRDHEWGTLVGQTTFGKGIMQSIFPLGDGSAVKLTTGRFFTKSGHEIHENGVAPDVEVGFERIEPYSLEVDNQVQRALEILREKL